MITNLWKRFEKGLRGLSAAPAARVLLLVFAAAVLMGVSAGAGWSKPAAAAEWIEPYEGHGTIDGLYDDKIVIGDSLYVLSGLVRYYRDHTLRETIGRYHFKDGTQVGFLVNREGQVEALFLDE